MTLDEDLFPYEHALVRALGMPFSKGNRVKALRNGDEIFPAMLDAIANAQHRIDFLTFVYWDGEIAQGFARALSSQAAAGKRVRVLLDAYGARPMPPECVEMMEAAGVELRWFRPVSTFRLWRVDKRTHRKILTIDERQGFTGGVGIAKEWTGDAENPNEWRETHFSFEGPGVLGLCAAFLDNWNEAGGSCMEPTLAFPATFDDGVPIQVLRSSTTVGWTDAATLLRAVVDVSRQSLLITTPYFAPGDLLVQLLCEAVERGVSVELLIPGEHNDQPLPLLAAGDKVERLLNAGVKIYRFQPTQLHAKLMVVDGCLSVVGSANLNHRSLGKDEECCASVLCRALAQTLAQQFREDIERAEVLDSKVWAERSSLHRLKERAARLIIEQL